ncbi:IDI-3 protein expressed during vegetative incompatibility [Madurella fahalii]|uniref:IDI-3 protein expressed during vegetative incompatibility n=1 Tax=Madurella fahalii TaxID=1157608 RepID=A0ABQ0GGC3_9PEZI
MLRQTLFALLCTVALTVAAPAEAISTRAEAEIQPSAVLAHSLNWSFANYCNAPTSYSYIFRHVFDGLEYGQSAMFTFTYPAASAGKQCWLEFFHGEPNYISDPNGVRIDVFRQWAPATCTDGSMSNNRDAHLGRLNVPGAGKATWEVTYRSHLTTKRPCAAPGTIEGLELSAVGDNTAITHPQGPGVGLRIMYA